MYKMIYSSHTHNGQLCVKCSGQKFRFKGFSGPTIQKKGAFYKEEKWPVTRRQL